MLAKKLINPFEKFKGYKKTNQMQELQQKIYTEYKNRYFCDECSNKVKNG